MLVKKPKIIVVDKRQYQFIKPGEVAETTPMGPRFGIVIYNTKNKNAFLGHFKNPIEHGDEVDKMLNEARKLFMDKNYVEVYVGGGAPESDLANVFKYTKARREKLEEKLKETGFNIVKVNYQNTLDLTVLRIDTNTGEVHYDMNATWQS